MEGCGNAQGCEHRDIEPVHLLQFRVTVESVIDTRDGRSPYQNHDTKIVELVSESLYIRAVVADDMISTLE